MASVTFPKFPKREKTGNAGFSRNSRAPFIGGGNNGKEKTGARQAAVESQADPLVWSPER